VSLVSPLTEVQSGEGALRRSLRELLARRETVWFLTISGLRAGHRDKILGNLWNLLDPLLFMLVYYFVFGVLFGMTGGARPARFMLYILTGVLMYRFIDSAITQSSTCIRANRGLIHEISFPKAVFPLSVVFARLYDFLWGLVVLAAFLLLAGIWPTIHFLWLPLVVALLVLLVLGLSLIVAYLGAFFADTTNVVTVVLRLLFYLSPVFYYVRERPGISRNHVFLAGYPTGRFCYFLNPFACLMESLRDAILWGTTPELGLTAYAAAVALVMCVAGFWIFCRGEGKFAKYV